jgi:hypothetical protein
MTTEPPDDDLDDDQDEPVEASRAPARSGSSVRLAKLSQMEERVRFAEDSMSTGKDPRQAARAVRERFGITRRQANAYVAHVLRRWSRDGQDEPRESKRERIRAQLQKIVEMAFERTQHVRSGRDGLKEVAAPDLRAAARALQVLAALEGLVDRQAQVQTLVGEKTQQEVEALLGAVRSSLGEEAFKAVDRAIDAARNPSGARAPATGADPDG